MLFGCICRCFISNPSEIHTSTGCSKPMDPLLAWMVEVWHGQGARWEAKNAKWMLHPIQVDPILYKLLIVRYMLRAILFFLLLSLLYLFPSQKNPPFTSQPPEVLGGSSALNGLLYVRGLKSDYDRWSMAGNVGWSYEELLPCFRSCEDAPYSAQHRGQDGPMSVSEGSYVTDLAERWSNACAEVTWLWIWKLQKGMQWKGMADGMNSLTDVFCTLPTGGLSSATGARYERCGCWWRLSWCRSGIFFEFQNTRWIEMFQCLTITWSSSPTQQFAHSLQHTGGKTAWIA